MKGEEAEQAGASWAAGFCGHHQALKDADDTAHAQEGEKEASPSARSSNSD